jgi:N-acetylglutamate synthase-like GNAT family acetyltransferase
MRSVVTLPPLRGRGIGAAIVSALEAEAQLAKCSAVYLLTTTAQGLFEKLGYEKRDRAQAPASIRATTQFSSLCPESAALMLKRLS